MHSLSATKYILSRLILTIYFNVVLFCYPWYYYDNRQAPSIPNRLKILLPGLGRAEKKGRKKEEAMKRKSLNSRLWRFYCRKTLSTKFMSTSAKYEFLFIYNPCRRHHLLTIEEFIHKQTTVCPISQLVLQKKDSFILKVHWAHNLTTTRSDKIS